MMLMSALDIDKVKTMVYVEIEQSSNFEVLRVLSTKFKLLLKLQMYPNDSQKDFATTQSSNTSSRVVCLKAVASPD